MTIDERIEILAAIGDDPEMREAFKQTCASDPVFFVNAC